MYCIRCKEYIFPNDCFCDVCEIIGCGCSIQPPTEIYLQDPDNNSQIGPFCSVCAEEVEKAGSIRTYRKTNPKLKISKVQIQLVKYLRRAFVLKETENGYVIFHVVIGFVKKIRTSTVSKLIELDIIRYGTQDNLEDKNLELTNFGKSIELDQKWKGDNHG